MEYHRRQGHAGQRPNANWAPNAGPFPNGQPNGIDNFHAPGMDRGAPYMSQNRRSFTFDSRPGHFPDISTFARCDGNNVLLCGIDPEDATFARLEAGHIISIRDVDDHSRLHNRIMLVIRTNRTGSSFSMTCLAFCQHRDRGGPMGSDFLKEHARVVCARTDDGHAGTGNGLCHLRVYIGPDDLGFKPQPEIWLNVREIWNVDLLLAVAVLGKAEPQSFVSFIDKVKQVFCDTIGNLDQSPMPVRSMVLEQNNEQAVASSPEDDNGQTRRVERRRSNKTKTYIERGPRGSRRYIVERG